MVVSGTARDMMLVLKVLKVLKKKKKRNQCGLYIEVEKKNLYGDQKGGLVKHQRQQAEI